MTFRVKLTERAQKDTEELYRWVVHHAPHQGPIWYNGLIDAINSLKRHPQRCPISPEGRELDEPIRQLLYGKRPYRILFLIVGNEVEVLHIRRRARKEWNLEL